jgi:hypothetical protein
VNDRNALKLLPRFFGDHFFERPFDFAAVCHNRFSRLPLPDPRAASLTA